ncbi:hypothetical protein [uncultured Psychroserpens sp.]|uniref:hypothetical protein n=1 Tax=uncultured Psychroserpens sp. TaxID=255436 RepID=UPI002623212F|nr:hypothetical protein [uncultured Psychroserpens sp.]
MLESTEYLYTISAIVNVFAILLVTAASIIIFIKNRTITTTIVFIGAILMMITTIIGFLINIFSTSDNFEMMFKVRGAMAILSSLSYGLFCFGLFFFALEYFKKPIPKNEFLD